MNDNSKYDEALGLRLSQALSTEAEQIAVPANAWQRFRDSAQPAGDVIPVSSPVDPASAAAPGEDRHSWRVPLIAAASVAAVAVAAAVIATSLLSPDGTTAAPAPATNSVAPETVSASPAGAPIAVPVYCRTDHGGPAAPQPATMTTSDVKAAPCADEPTEVRMSFVEGKGQKRDLSGALDLGGGARISGVTGSDGTPLGFLSAFRPGAAVAETSTGAGTGTGSGTAGASSDSDPAATLWGAASPEVAQLLVTLSASPLLPGGANNPAFDSVEAENWRFASTDPATPVGEFFRAPFTEIAGRYRGFALRVPSVFTLIHLTALDADGRVLQDRTMDLATGAVSDPSTPASTTGLLPTSTTATHSPAPDVGRPPTSAAPGVSGPPTGTSQPTPPVQVPINTSYEIVGSNGGVSTNPPYSGPASGGPPAYGLSAIQMDFVGGAAPTATLRGNYVRNTAEVTTNNMDQTSDGTTLGYVASEASITTAGTGSTTTVWGAVGPDVDTLQIEGDLQDPESSLQGGLRARWIFTVDAAGTGPAGSGNAGVNTELTPIGDGYHGFAVQLPGNPASITVTAIGRDGHTLQTRQFGITTGRETSDPPSIGGPPPTSG